MRDMAHVPRKYPTGLVVNYVYRGEACAGKLLMFDGNDCTYLISLHGENNRWIGQEDITSDLETVIDDMVSM